MPNADEVQESGCCAGVITLVKKSDQCRTPEPFFAYIERQAYQGSILVVAERYCNGSINTRYKAREIFSEQFLRFPEGEYISVLHLGPSVAEAYGENTTYVAICPKDAPLAFSNELSACWVQESHD
jgi:hypothetical protein